MSVVVGFFFFLFFFFFLCVWLLFSVVSDSL